MGFGNVSERRSAPPQVGVSVVIWRLVLMTCPNMAQRKPNLLKPELEHLIPVCGCRWSSESVSLSSALGLCPEAT